MQLGSRGAVIFPSSQQVQGRAMMGDQENLIFTAQNVIDWPIIYFFKACIRYFSLFLKDKCISSLVRTKYIEVFSSHYFTNIYSLLGYNMLPTSLKLLV